MVIQKMSELVVTSDSPIDDLDEDSSEGLQGPLSSISENPASPMTSLGNEADEDPGQLSMCKMKLPHRTFPSIKNEEKMADASRPPQPAARGAAHKPRQGRAHHAVGRGGRATRK